MLICITSNESVFTKTIDFLFLDVWDRRPSGIVAKIDQTSLVIIYQSALLAAMH